MGVGAKLMFGATSRQPACVDPVGLARLQLCRYRYLRRPIRRNFVIDAVDVIADNDPKEMSEAFRGAQFDHGLAWVYFDRGHGGLGVSPILQKQVEIRLRSWRLANATCHVLHAFGRSHYSHPRQ